MLKINDMKWFEEHAKFYGFEKSKYGAIYSLTTKAVSKTHDYDYGECKILVNQRDNVTDNYIYLNYSNEELENCVQDDDFIDDLFEIPNELFELIKMGKVDKV